MADGVMKVSPDVPQKIKDRTTLCYLYQENSTSYYRDICTSMCIAALFAIARR